MQRNSVCLFPPQGTESHRSRVACCLSAAAACCVLRKVNLWEAARNSASKESLSADEELLQQDYVQMDEMLVLRLEANAKFMWCEVNRKDPPLVLSQRQVGSAMCRSSSVSLTV